MTETIDLTKTPGVPGSLERLQDVSQSLKDKENSTVSEAIASFIIAGIPIKDIEVVHETYSENNDFTTIHSRCVVRVRK